MPAANFPFFRLHSNVLSLESWQRISIESQFRAEPDGFGPFFFLFTKLDCFISFWILRAAEPPRSGALLDLSCPAARYAKGSIVHKPSGG